MTLTTGRRWCSWHKKWEVAPRCAECGKTAKLQDMAGLHRWWWPCGHADVNRSRPVVTA